MARPERRPPGAPRSGFLRFEAKLVEPGGLGQERGLVGEIGQGRPPPQGQGVLEGRHRDVRIHREGLLPVPHELGESRGVQLRRIEPQAIAGSVALDPVRSEGLAEMRDIGLDDVPGLLGRLLPPDLVDQGLRGHELVRTKHQVREDGALLRPAEGDGAVSPLHFEGAEDAEQHHAAFKR